LTYLLLTVYLPQIEKLLEWVKEWMIELVNDVNRTCT
jgi:hypothetical protein